MKKVIIVMLSAVVTSSAPSYAMFSFLGNVFGAQEAKKEQPDETQKLQQQFFENYQYRLNNKGDQPSILIEPRGKTVDQSKQTDVPNELRYVEGFRFCEAATGNNSSVHTNLQSDCLQVYRNGKTSKIPYEKAWLRLNLIENAKTAKLCMKQEKGRMVLLNDAIYMRDLDNLSDIKIAQKDVLVAKARFEGDQVQIVGGSWHFLEKNPDDRQEAKLHIVKDNQVKTHQIAKILSHPLFIPQQKNLVGFFSSILYVAGDPQSKNIILSDIEKLEEVASFSNDKQCISPCVSGDRLFFTLWSSKPYIGWLDIKSKQPTLQPYEGTEGRRVDAGGSAGNSVMFYTSFEATIYDKRTSKFTKLEIPTHSRLEQALINPTDEHTAVMRVDNVESIGDKNKRVPALLVWDVSRKRIIKTIEMSYKLVEGIKWSEDGAYLEVTSIDPFSYNVKRIAKKNLIDPDSKITMLATIENQSDDQPIEEPVTKKE